MNNLPVFKRIRESKAARVLASGMILELLVQTLSPFTLSALTSGPTQPEVQGFQPIGITEMVDPFTGDFSYNIPLMEIGGYPLNLSYQSGISMDQEASWAGLGWNLHTGAITRQLRGLPDDFWNEVVTERSHLKPNKTIGVNTTFDMELFGFQANDLVAPSGSTGNLSVGIGVVYNNYTGVDLTTTLGLGLSGGNELPMNGGFTMSSGKDGLQINPTISYAARFAKSSSDASGKVNIGIGAGISSRRGLTSIGFNTSVNYSRKSGTISRENAKENKMIGTKSGGGMGSSSTIDFGTATYTPSIEKAMETYSFSGRIKVGGATANQDFGGSVSAFGSVQRLAEKEVRIPAFGYMYSDKAQGDENVLLDYNREKDNNFSKHHKHLPVTSFTHDVFSISAQGLSGSFRPFRNEVGYVYNNRKFSPSISGSLGMEIGIGNIVDAGLDLSLNVVTSNSGAWKEDNEAYTHIPFRGRRSNDIREPYYFRMLGEKAAEADAAYLSSTLKGAQTIAYENSTAPLNPKVTLKNRFQDIKGTSLNGIVSNERNTRQSRNTAVYALTAAEISQAYPHKSRNLSPHARPNHIAEIVVVTPEGMRYVFGLTAYNTRQLEQSFAVGGTRTNPNGGLATGSAENQGGLVNYTATSASADNDKGIDNYFQETETPAYVHSWMLTEILSADYVDVSGNGPSQDDLGAYVLFEYGNRDGSGQRVPDVQDYGWRTPAAGSMKAGYMEGLKTYTTDDRGNVVYGTKDIWYCHSIQSKTHKVSFELEDRLDACGTDMYGNLQPSKKLKCIKSISYESAEATGSTPVVKKVHFEYDYSLCPSTPNSLDADQGKLTLKKLYFTYENSNTGIYSPYEFSYNQKDGNGADFEYVYGHSDRWGILKSPADNPDAMSNSDYPYALQDPAQQAEYASAWSLSKIDLPSGGSVSVTYESDDYAYVQDRRASAMYSIAGFAGSKNGTISDQTYTLGSGPQNYLIVNVPDAGATLSSEDFRRRYLQEDRSPGDQYGPLKYLYFRFLINVNKPADKKYEYVSGYAEIDRSGDYCGMINSTQAYIKIKNIIPAPGGQASSPFAYAAWSFSRLYTPEYAYNQPQVDDNNAEQVIKLLSSASILNSLLQMLQGVNGRMRNEGYGSHVDTDRSWVRLFDPDHRKYGGGLRVQKIEISDGWNDMSPDEAGRSYGQQFSYTLPNGQSSGVASWEPAMGADENPFKLPVYNSDPQRLLVMNERFYVEEPFGESFMPSPSVGYSRVEVKDIVYDAGVTSRSTGKTVHEYYTAREFPVIVKHTEIDAWMKRSDPIVSLLSFNSWNFLTASQGYSIELNDMHGKAKAQRMYAEGATEPFAYTEYLYRRDASGKLDNYFNVVGRDGIQSREEIGVDYDMVADFREQDTEGYNGSLAFNLNYAQLSAAPLISFSLFPGFKREHTRFRSAVVTKVIQRYGLQEKTISFDKGALLETRTLTLDKTNGNPLVQELTNEYKDKYYKTDMPAHWVYRGMGQAAQNIQFRFATTGLNDNSRFDRFTGEIKPTLYSYLQPGDEVYLGLRYGNAPVNPNSNAYRYWVAKDEPSGKWYLINYAGQKAVFPPIYPPALVFTVIRSGHRNQHPVTVSSVTSMENPLRNVSGTYRLVFDSTLRVLATGATEFREQWHTTFSMPEVYTDTIRVPAADSAELALLAVWNDVFSNQADAILEQHETDPSVGYPYNYNTGTNWAGDYLLHCSMPAYTGFGRIDTDTVDAAWSQNEMPPPGLWGIQANTQYTRLGISLMHGSGSCPYCERMLLVPLEDISTFTTTNWTDVVSIDYILDTHSEPASFNWWFQGNNPIFSTYFKLVSATMSDGSHKQFILYDNCFELGETAGYTYETTYGCSDTGKVVNPYLAGILGNWRTLRNWVFQGNRNNTNVYSAETLRSDGYLAHYKPYHTYNGSSGFWQQNTQVNNLQYENWNWTNAMTVYSPYGFDLENINPLGNYSAAVYGFKNMLSTGIAANAMYKEIGYDSFEDYYQDAFDAPCKRPHFWIADDLDKLTDTDAHSGSYSMQLDDEYTKNFELSLPLGQQQDPIVPYVLDHNDLLPVFSPNSGASAKEFVLSFWAKGTYTHSTYTYTNISADILLGASSVMVPGSLQKSKLAEGWQKYEYRFIIPASSSGTLSLVLDPGAEQTLFDDIRIHPFDANMKSYAYDRDNFRFRAELDENNFATFYEYDEEGKLVRVKKETERGVMTIQESNTHTFKR